MMRCFFMHLGLKPPSTPLLLVTKIFLKNEKTVDFSVYLCYYIQAVERQQYARVVELADSLDSGSSVHYARAGSSPASRTKIRNLRVSDFLFFQGISPFSIQNRPPFFVGGTDEIPLSLSDRKQKKMSPPGLGLSQGSRRGFAYSTTGMQMILLFSFIKSSG